MKEATRNSVKAAFQTVVGFFKADTTGQNDDQTELSLALQKSGYFLQAKILPAHDFAELVCAELVKKFDWPPFEDRSYTDLGPSLLRVIYDLVRDVGPAETTYPTRKALLNLTNTYGSASAQDKIMAIANAQARDYLLQNTHAFRYGVESVISKLTDQLTPMAKKIASEMLNPPAAKPVSPPTAESRPDNWNMP